MGPERSAPLRQLDETLKITRNQRFFLSAGPALYPSFRRDGIDDSFEIFAVHQHHGSAFGSDAVILSSLVLGNAGFKIGTRRSCVISVVRAPKNIEPSAHLPAPSFETAGFADLLRTRLL